MTNQEFTQKAEQAKAIMLELCEKLDTCYESHLKTEQEMAKKAA